MYFSEEDGAMLRKMLVQCRHCNKGPKYVYRLNHVPSDCCPNCGEVDFDIVQEHYEESPTEPTLTDTNEGGSHA